MAAAKATAGPEAPDYLDPAARRPGQRLHAAWPHRRGRRLSARQRAVGAVGPRRPPQYRVPNLAGYHAGLAGNSGPMVGFAFACPGRGTTAEALWEQLLAERPGDRALVQHEWDTAYLLSSLVTNRLGRDQLLRPLTDSHDELDREVYAEKKSRQHVAPQAPGRDLLRSGRRASACRSSAEASAYWQEAAGHYRRLAAAWRRPEHGAFPGPLLFPADERQPQGIPPMVRQWPASRTPRSNWRRVRPAIRIRFGCRRCC